ncbi:MAG TPA: hypothetical protein VH478_09150 [Trebonia sp.]|nr:hypothetical protein [Trebonia sp.]
MLQALPGDDHVSEAVGQRDGADVADDHLVHAVPPGDLGAASRQVDADVAVPLARDERVQEPAAAGDVQEHRAVAAGRGHVGSALPGEPAQAGERPAALPPQGGPLVVLR